MIGTNFPVPALSTPFIKVDSGEQGLSLAQEAISVTFTGKQGIKPKVFFLVDCLGWAAVEFLSFRGGHIFGKFSEKMATLNEKKTCSERMADFRRFVWNPETKLFMGRSLINWGRFLCARFFSSFW